MKCYLITFADEYCGDGRCSCPPPAEPNRVFLNKTKAEKYLEKIIKEDVRDAVHYEMCEVEFEA